MSLFLNSQRVQWNNAMSKSVETTAVKQILQKTISQYSNNRIDRIKDYAFCRCRSLTTVDLPQVTVLGSNAFQYCSALTSVNLPQITNVEEYTFYYCNSLTTVDFPLATAIKDFAFYSCKALTSVNLPQVTSIGSDAFYYCSVLSSINLPQVTSIGTYAFAFCYLLPSINLPLVTSIQNSAFYHCNSLSSINLPQATSIGSYAFTNCSALTSINLPQVETIRNGTFASCFNLISVDCPLVSSIYGGCTVRVSGSKSTTNIFGGFAYCSSLTTVSFPQLKHINSAAFYRCSYLTSFIGPEVLTVRGSHSTSASTYSNRTYKYSVYGGAFAYCFRLSMVSFPKVTMISDCAFYACYNLLSVYLLGSSVPNLVSKRAFDHTPISTDTTSTGGVYGSIYVPASLYNDYITAMNWSAYSSRFVSV